MGAKNKKCPLCNRKLAEVNGVPTCPDCGYRELQTANTDYRSSDVKAAVPGEPVKEKEKKGNKSQAGKMFAAIGSVLAVCVVGIVISFAKSGMRDALESAADALAGKKEEAAAAREESAGKGSAGSGEGGKSDENSAPADGDGRESGGKVQTYRAPQSEFLTVLLEELFGKPVGRISYEELCSIVYLDIYYLEDTDALAVDVIFEDGTDGTYLMDDAYVDTSDFACLEGLEYLYLENGSMSYSTDWHNLKNLWVLSCDASLEDLTGYMDVSQLVYLESGDNFFLKDLSVLEEYTGLEYLELNAETMSSIAGISRASSLRGLYIADGDGISDFSELYDMPWLEELAIESQGLKDIGFVSGMDNLQYLSLEGTSVKSLNALADCADTLTALCLDENYYVEDISPVFECTGLESLQLWADYQFDVPMEVPDFSAMTNLTSLTIENYDRFTNLALLTGLTELTIECPGSGDGEPFKALTNLRTLNLVDMSIYDSLIEGVAGLEKLEVLNLEDSFIWCDISPVFGMPNLRELDLEWAECGLNPEKLSVSESLTSLKLVHTTFDSLSGDGSWDYGSNDKELSMQEVLEVLSPCMPRLQRLYVPEQELEALTFVTDLSELLLLDVTDNYITDLTPLVGLENLVILMCEDNPVQSTEGLEDVFIYQ